MRMLTDNPITSTKEDSFGFAPFATILKDAILETTPLPFCVGIFGPWGAGKTSFMQMLRSLMEDQANVQTIWFNAWKYDKKEDIWNALIQTILSSITEEIGDPDLKKKAKILLLQQPG